MKWRRVLPPCDFPPGVAKQGPWIQPRLMDGTGIRGAFQTTDFARPPRLLCSNVQQRPSPGSYQNPASPPWQLAPVSRGERVQDGEHGCSLLDSVCSWCSKSRCLVHMSNVTRWQVNLADPTPWQSASCLCLQVRHTYDSVACLKGRWHTL